MMACERHSFNLSQAHLDAVEEFRHARRIGTFSRAFRAMLGTAGLPAGAVQAGACGRTISASLSVTPEDLRLLDAWVAAGAPNRSAAARAAIMLAAGAAS